MSFDSATTPIAANIAAALTKLRDVVLSRYDEYKAALKCDTPQTLPEVKELIEECAVAIGDGVHMLMDMIDTENMADGLGYILSVWYCKYYGTYMVDSKAAAEKNFEVSINECCLLIGELEKSPRSDSSALNELCSALYTLLFSTLYDALGTVIESAELESVQRSKLGAALSVSKNRLCWMRACIKVATHAAETIDNNKRVRSVESESQPQLLQEMLQNKYQMCIAGTDSKLSDYAGLVASFL